ncbi:MAG: hypothetical protein Q9170_006187 [Blastenia crenularia]
MHKYRSSARQAAWYQDEGDSTNFNPFGKYRARRGDLNTNDEENAYRTRTNQSESQVPTSIELNRRSQNGEIFPGPPHSTSMPATAKRGSFPAANGDVEDPTHTEKSQDSGTATSNTVIPEDEPVILDAKPEADVGARKRRFGGVMSRFHNKKDEDDSLERTTTGRSKLAPPKFTFMGQLKATVFNSPINILLVMVPVGIGVHFSNLDPIGVFVINFIAIIPLAAMLSYATEELALRTGETLGGLLNATFGNAVELIVSIIALTQDKVDIVQESLIGSMLSNLLLVMGMCFFFGGLTRIKQHFNVTVAQTASSLLALAIGSLVIPAAYEAWGAKDGTDLEQEANVTKLSRGTAVLLLLVYAAYLIFQLLTHATMYNAPSPKGEKRNKKPGAGDATKGLAQMGAGASAAMGGANAQETPLREPEEEREQPQLSLFVALLTLGISTALVGICAEFMTDAIDPITKPCGPLPRTFVGLILLPIVGNAAEHATAVTVAIKDKMDLAIGVAVGSSMQIALLVIPFVVILGWIMGKSDMNLAFDAFQVILLFISILLMENLIGSTRIRESPSSAPRNNRDLYVCIIPSLWFWTDSASTPLLAFHSISSLPLKSLLYVSWRLGEILLGQQEKPPLDAETSTRGVDISQLRRYVSGMFGVSYITKLKRFPSGFNFFDVEGDFFWPAELPHRLKRAIIEELQAVIAGGEGSLLSTKSGSGRSPRVLAGSWTPRALRWLIGFEDWLQ